MRYRPEIDGLRSISVFAIILYHAKFVLFGYTFFQGGFIGVDIFFVISGYLITTLILKEIYKTNQFSFKHFYERRIRRILPLLLFVIIITSIIAYFILLPQSFIDLARSIVSIFFFASNFYFWLTGRKYGAESELERPLLHIWSLSVEEQFYILLPVFLIIIIKFFKKHLLIVLFLSFLTSLLLSEYCSRFYPEASFYQLPFRLFELLIGSLLSYFELNNGEESRKSYSVLNQICPSLGIILILYSFLFFNLTEIFHPSTITLIPLIGVSLIIMFSKKEQLITKILSSRIFVFFGLISFSLYLWHYPIFAYLRYFDIFNNSIWIKLLSVLLTIILSILSYKLIEKPFRNKNIISIKALTAYILISIIILLSYSFYVIRTKGIKSRLPSINSSTLKQSIDENLLNRVSGKLKNILLIGDSHADTLKYHLNIELAKKLYNFYTKSSTLYLGNSNLIDQKIILEDKEIDKFLEDHKNLIVVWHQRWTHQLLERYPKDINTPKLQSIDVQTKTLEQRQKYIMQSIKLSAKNILERDHSLILVYPVPEMDFDVPKLYWTKYLLSKILDRKLEIPILTGSYDVYKIRHKMIFEILDSIQGPNVHRVYPHKSFCNTVIVNRCVVSNKEHLFYYDHDHLSLEGSKYVINDIMKVIQQIEVDKKVKSSNTISSQN